MKKIQIIYYSGTGCTKAVAENLEKAFSGRGCDVETYRITTGTACEFADADSLVLLFPVHAFTMPGPVFEWLRSIGEGGGQQAAVISVSGGGEESPNTASRVRAKKILKKKGYDVFYDDSIIMLSNAAVATPEPFATMLLKVLPEKAGAAADGILSGERKELPVHFFDKFFAWSGRSIRHVAKLWGRGNKVSSECDGCGICVGACSSGNITMAGSKPDFGKNCCMCMGCFYACPQRALSPKMAKAFIVKDYNLKGLGEKALAAEHVDVSGLSVSWIWLGVKKYLSP